jgi:hypothetical protein
LKRVRHKWRGLFTKAIAKKKERNLKFGKEERSVSYKLKGN